MVPRFAGFMNEELSHEPGLAARLTSGVPSSGDVAV
jgi:hypothetical protein